MYLIDDSTPFYNYNNIYNDLIPLGIILRFLVLHDE